MSTELWMKIIKLIVLVLIVQLFFIAYTLFQSYEGREKVIENSRAGCERSKLDRNANARGWRNAEAARAAAGEWDVAAQYASIASELEERSRVNCNKAFPKASFIP